MVHDCKRMSGHIKLSTFQVENNEASFLLEWHSPKMRHVDHTTRIYTSDISKAQDAINLNKRVYITAVCDDYEKYTATTFKIIE
jgi:hypothetical protein